MWPDSRRRVCVCVCVDLITLWEMKMGLAPFLTHQTWHFQFPVTSLFFPIREPGKMDVARVKIKCGMG